MDNTQNLQKNQISNYKVHVGEQQKTLSELNNSLQKEIKKKNIYKNFAIGGCSVSIMFILLFVL